MLLGLARAFLSSAVEAEDALTETYRRWYAEGDRGAMDPGAWLAGTLKEVCRSRPARTPGEGARDDRPRAAGAAAEPARRSLRGLWAGPAGTGRHGEVVRAFRKACESHDLRLLAGLLAPEVSAVFDGGGRIRTPERPVGGADDVTRCLGVLLAPRDGVVIAEATFNGRAGLVVGHGGEAAAAISLDVRGDRVVNVWLVLNPDKLRGWERS
ncbi:hypothetical protein ABZ479_27705 [Streptomyces sp. NPDC005722]